MAEHGGTRKGAGRIPELEEPQKVLVTLEGRHLDYLEDYEEDNELNGRSASLRKILDQKIKRLR